MQSWQVRSLHLGKEREPVVSCGRLTLPKHRIPWTGISCGQSMKRRGFPTKWIVGKEMRYHSCIFNTGEWAPRGRVDSPTKGREAGMSTCPLIICFGSAKRLPHALCKHVHKAC